jgi:P-type Ca2+ transporter type 2B
MDEDGVIHAIEKKDFTLIGIFGIKDIIRKEVPDAVAKC